MTESKEVNRKKLEDLAQEIGIRIDPEWQHWNNYNLLAKLAELRKMKRVADSDDDDPSLFRKISAFKKTSSS